MQQSSTVMVDHRGRGVGVDSRAETRQALRQLKLQAWMRDEVESKRRRVFVTRR